MYKFERPDHSIHFLDITISRTDQGLKYIFYQKSTNSGRYLHYTSHCAMSTKVNIIKSETLEYNLYIVYTQCTMYNVLSKPKLKLGANGLEYQNQFNQKSKM